MDEIFLANLIATGNDILAMKKLDKFDWENLTIPVCDYRNTVPAVSNNMIYARELHIGPVKMLVSYLSCSWEEVALKGEIGKQMHSYLRYLKEINELNVNLGMLDMSDAYQSQDEFLNLLGSHYGGELMKRFYDLLGAVPILGAPVELFHGICTGFKDAFYSPSHGVLRPASAFGDGKWERSSTLFNGTIGAAAKEIGKVTSLASRGANRLTFDREYKQIRALVAEHRARTVGEGLLFAGRDIAVGFVGGVTGIVMNPITRGREEGLAGFSKGLATGLLGVVTKPVVGILDAMSQLSYGLQNAAESGRKRLRMPRPFNMTRVVLEFDGGKADAQEILKTLDNSIYALSLARFLYPKLAACSDSEKFTHVLISNQAIFRLFGGRIDKMSVKWRLALEDISSSYVREETIRLITKSGGEKKLKMKNSDDAAIVHEEILQAREMEKDRVNGSLYAPVRLNASMVQLLQSIDERGV